MQVFEAFSQLKDGFITKEYEKRFRCSLWSRNDKVIEKVCDFVRADHRLTIKAVEELWIYFGSCHTILRPDFGMRSVWSSSHSSWQYSKSTVCL